MTPADPTLWSLQAELCQSGRVKGSGPAIIVSFKHSLLILTKLYRAYLNEGRPQSYIAFSRLCMLMWVIMHASKYYPTDKQAKSIDADSGLI